MVMNHEFYHNLNMGERHLVDWQYGGLGGFFTALWDAIRRADGGNLDRLGKGFPEDVEAYRRYSGEAGYWERIRNGLYPEGGGE